MLRLGEIHSSNRKSANIHYFNSNKKDLDAGSFISDHREAEVVYRQYHCACRYLLLLSATHGIYLLYLKGHIEVFFSTSSDAIQVHRGNLVRISQKTLIEVNILVIADSQQSGFFCFFFSAHHSRLREAFEKNNSLSYSAYQGHRKYAYIIEEDSLRYSNIEQNAKPCYVDQVILSLEKGGRNSSVHEQLQRHE